MMFALRTRGEWLDLGNSPEPIAYFKYEAHAHKFGAMMYGKYYSVHPHVDKGEGFRQSRPENTWMEGLEGDNV